MAFEFLARLELHIIKLSEELLLLGLVHAIECRNAFVDGNTCTRVCSVGDARLDIFGMESNFLVKNGIVVALELAPCSNSLVPVFSLRSILAALEVSEGGLVGGYQTCTRTHLDGKVR